MNANGPHKNINASEAHRWVVFVAGATASGKTTVAKYLASSLDAQFVEGDDFHSKANIAKMHKGEPLTDSDRQGWLEALSEHASAYPQQPGSHHLIISCSALKLHYRDVLRDGCHHAGDLQVHFLFLDAPESVLRERAETRQGHFAKAELVTSQFDILERPLIEEHDTTMISVNRPIEEVQRDALETIEKVTEQNT